MNRIYISPVVKQILIACIVLFIGTELLGRSGRYDLVSLLAMHFPSNPAFKPWQIVTHMFMHGGIAHIAFNMIGLVSIGSIIERFLGGKKFLQLFFFSGLGAIALHLGVQLWRIHEITNMWMPSMNDLGINIYDGHIYYKGNVDFTKDQLQDIGAILNQSVLGASGALYGVVVAFAYLFPNTELMIIFIPYPIKAKYLIPAIIALDLIFGFSNFQWDPMAHFAHIGGAITGFAMVYYWRKFDRNNFY